MADAAAAALVKIIFEKLADEAFKKYARSQGIHSELENLGRELSLIQALLHDASDKVVTERSVGIWLDSLQHLAYDIEDVLDDVATEAMRLELTQESGAIISKMVIGIKRRKNICWNNTRFRLESDTGIGTYCNILIPFYTSQRKTTLFKDGESMVLGSFDFYRCSI